MGRVLADIFSNFAYLECVRRQPALLCFTVIMFRLFISLLYISVIAVLASCGDGEAARGVLRRADSLMEEHTDSAMALLRRDSVMLVHAPKPQRMAYILSKTEAEDKLYITHSSDSAMQLAVKYFDRHGTALQRTRAWYLLGRVYCDMLLYGNALTAFDAAIAVQPDDDSTVCRYKARACTWASYVYEEKELHKDALRYNKMSYDYAHRCDVPSIEVYALRDIGRSYSDLEYNSIAIPYYLRAAKMGISLGDSILYGNIVDELASIYIEERMFDKAHAILSIPNKKDVEMDIAARYFTLGMYYEFKGMPDSAVYYNELGMPHASASVNKDVALKMAKLYDKLGDTSKKEKYYRLYDAYSDSVKHEDIVNYGNMLSQIETLFDVERENMVLVNEKNRFLTFVLILVLFFVVAVALGYSIYKYEMKKRLQLQERTKVRHKKKYNEYLRNVHEKNKRINELEEEQTILKETLTETIEQLKQNKAELSKRNSERIEFEQRHNELLIADFSETDVYKIFQNIRTTPSSADYHKLAEVLNKTFDNFTNRLKDIYPKISVNEIRICCMIKAGLTAKEICNITTYSYASLSMTKLRLYEKIFRKKGTAKDLDNFIREF